MYPLSGVGLSLGWVLMRGDQKWGRIEIDPHVLILTLDGHGVDHERLFDFLANGLFFESHEID